MNCLSIHGLGRLVIGEDACSHPEANSFGERRRLPEGVSFARIAKMQQGGDRSRVCLILRHFCRDLCHVRREPSP